MFTGIVEEIGTIIALESMGEGVRLHINAPQSARELEVNDSISVNGVCQTVIWNDIKSFKVEAVEETLKKTSLGKLTPGSEVNLELPMRLNERLGGHLVLGHVDTVGKITEIVSRESSWMFSVTVSDRLAKYLVPTGSVTVDGVSLTIADIHENNFKVSIIPHTMEHTIFKNYKLDMEINIEFDIVGKYIENMFPSVSSMIEDKLPLTEKHLRALGY